MTERFKTLEIEINSTCDMACPHCDRFIDCAPTSSMTVEQIGRFVEESLVLGWEWDRIHILGGEPTLHPELHKVVDALVRYRERYPNVLLRLISNGSGKLLRHRPFLERMGIAINVESKGGGLPSWFTNARRAPIDVLGSKDPLPPCAIFGISGCGIGLTKHGFFLCGAGASCARVAGLDIGIQRLADLTYEAALKQAKAVCNICSHHNLTRVPAAQDASISPFWQKAIAAYQRQAPRMTLYGAA